VLREEGANSRRAVLSTVLSRMDDIRHVKPSYNYVK